MKKFYAFFAAALMSVSVFAAKDVVPSDAVLADYYNQGDVCVCFFVPAEMNCNNIVLTGSFNGWKSTAAECVAVEPVEGYDGWYVGSFEAEAEPDAEKGMQAKPIMLDVDGNFNWEYQIGAATAIRGGVQVVQGAYAGEIDMINYGADAPNVFTVDAWKQNPCTAIYHNYTVTVINDGCNGLILPYIVGGLNGWTFQQMQLDMAKTQEYQTPVYYYSFKAAEGTAYQIVSGMMDPQTGLIDSTQAPGWTEEAYMQKLVNGQWVRLPGEEYDNQLTHEDANIVWDLRSDSLRWARCAPAEPEEYVVLAVNLPVLNCPQAVEVIGSFDDWAGTAMEKLNTGWYFVELEAKASQYFKIRSAGSWDTELEIYDAENDEWKPVQDNQLVFGQLWQDDTYKGTPCKWIELDLSDPEKYRWNIITMTCAQAKQYTLDNLQPGETGTDFVAVTGYVTYTNGIVSRGQQTFWLDDKKGTAQTFQAYWCNLPEAEALNVGDKVTIKGFLTNYSGTTAEIKNGDTEILERVVIKRDTIEASICDAIAEGETLNDIEITNDFFIVEGVVANVGSQMNQYKQETFSLICESNGKELKVYNILMKDSIAAAVGDKVSVFGKIQNYHGTIEIISGTAKVLNDPITSGTVHLATVANYIDFQALSVSDPQMVQSVVTSTNPYTLPNGTVLRGFQKSDGTEAENKWNVATDYTRVFPTPEWEGVDSLKAGTAYRAASRTTIELGAFNLQKASQMIVYFQPNGDSDRGISVSILGRDPIEYIRSGVKIDGIRPAYAAPFYLPAGNYDAGDVVIQMVVNTSNIYGIGIQDVGYTPEPIDPTVFPTDEPLIWPIWMDEQTFTANQNSIVSDFRKNDADQFLYVWENTYYEGNATGLNFYGNNNGYLDFNVSSLGWAGAGLCLTGDGNGKGWKDAEKLRQAIVANPDEYFLHLAIKSTDNYSHCFYIYGSEATKFVLGSKSVYDGPVYQDFTRDGGWHEFYIPMSKFASALANTTSQANTNIFIMLSEGAQGAQLQLDAVYFCNRYAKENNVPEAYNPADDPSVNPGPFAISVTDNSLDDWNNLPSNYVAKSYCPAGASLTALKSVKVFADQTYINILVEPDMSKLPDLEWVPFHVFIDTDNSDRTGGYGDIFTDPNTDIMLEKAVFVNGQPYSYNPAVFKWWGEVGGYGWEWTDPSVEHTGDDNWGAIVGEGQLPIGRSQFVNGKIEIQLLRELIPANWNMNEFGIGFDIQQYWSSVGVLPCANATDGNPSGKAAKLKVKVHPSSPLVPIVDREVVIDGIKYYLNGEDTTATVIYKDGGYYDAIIIPAQVSYSELTYKVVAIGSDAFNSCRGLTSVTIPNSVTSIGDWAFGYCNSLTSIEIPNSVTSIGYGAFYGCRSLTSLEIPNSVKNCGGNLFGGCTNLNSIIAPADAFVNSWEYPIRLEHIRITAGLMQYDAFYWIASNAYALKTIDLAAIENTELQDNLFYNCYSLQKLVLPANLTRINYMAIAQCIHLDSIAIPAGVTEIGDRAFEDCRSLAKVEFAGTNLQRIGDWAFYNCHELSQINLPEGVTEIGKAAFYGCVYANQAYIPASVQAIGDNAFALCSKLSKMIVDAVVPPTVEDKTFYEVSTTAPVYVPANSVEDYKSHPVWGKLNIIGAQEGVENVQSDHVQCTKVIENGVLYLKYNGTKYNVQGTRVK